METMQLFLLWFFGILVSIGLGWLWIFKPFFERMKTIYNRERDQ